jgi:lipopolysaccharide/colanic/teichoic acid biosynthesis glycosyltransferase
MRRPGPDHVDGSSYDPAARVGAWTVGFHGGLTRADRREFAGVSVRDIALSRRSLGAGPMDALTELDTTGAVRLEPTRTEGRLHVGVNGSSAPSADVRVVLLPDADDQQAPATMAAVAEVTVAPVPARRSTDHPRSAAVAAELEARRRDLANPLDDLEAYIERRLEEAPFVFLPNRGRAYALAKRTFDVVGALGLLVVALPLMAVLATIIRIDSPGPALFRQTRVTRGGRTFRFYKFRTMYVDAKERFPELYAYTFTDSQFDDAFYKLADDPRNTRFGRWLRRTTLDELPNLFNVLRGDLSLVGPRPELPELVLHYRPEELACFFTKAGLTGLAQVAGRSLLTVRERLTLDVRYVAHQTLLLDLRILWRTVLVVVAGRGAF